MMPLMDGVKEDDDCFGVAGLAEDSPGGSSAKRRAAMGMAVNFILSSFLFLSRNMSLLGWDFFCGYDDYEEVIVLCEVLREG